MAHAIEEKEKELKRKIKLLHKDEEEMLEAIMTTMGMSATLTQFIAEYFKEEGVKLPTMVKYAMSITSGNMCALLSVHPANELERMKFPTYRMAENEQMEEYTRRKFINVITMLYETLVKEN